ncbi:MAG TPA: signal peptide peptidase SppA [Alphaproteobacteria bacterium]|nr:signal peptide peptidase SppA [Alphaproteobacteria bacterium]
MPSDIDTIVDRRRLKRRVAFWRFAAVIAIILAILAFASKSSGLFVGDHIARISLNGLITGNPQRIALLDKIAKDNSVKALIVRIDSPGGTITGSEELYHALRRVAARKPVVGVIGSVGASGAYIAALATDHIFARETSMTGSIGVIFQAPEISGLMDKLGIKVQQISSGPLKGDPSEFAPMSDKARQVYKALIMDGYDWFTGLVAKRRNLPLDEVKRLADGRVYTGRQAVGDKLIDAIGGERDARAWLASDRKISANLPVRDEDIDRERRLVDRLFSYVGGKSLLTERLTLDGLVALWHPTE